jgi:hypothetical protein
VELVQATLSSLKSASVFMIDSTLQLGPLRTFQGDLTPEDWQLIEKFRLAWKDVQDRLRAFKDVFSDAELEQFKLEERRKAGLDNEIELHPSGIGFTTIFCPECTAMMLMADAHHGLQHLDGCSNDGC